MTELEMAITGAATSVAVAEWWNRDTAKRLESLAADLAELAKVLGRV